MLFSVLVCSDDCRGICHGESILTSAGLDRLMDLSINHTSRSLHDEGQLDCIRCYVPCSCCKGKGVAMVCAVLLVILIYLPMCMVLMVVGIPFVALGLTMVYFYLIVCFWGRKCAVLLYRLLIDKSL